MLKRFPHYGFKHTRSATWPNTNFKKKKNGSPKLCAYNRLGLIAGIAMAIPAFRSDLAIPRFHSHLQISSLPHLSSNFRHSTHRHGQGFVAVREKFVCRALAGKKYSYGHDLYHLLGVESDASEQEIKRAYRWLQKKCHPDIAGQVGHDMAILLNEAYSILINAASRSIYDAERAEWDECEGYTGEPLYSTWFGPANEEKAIFVDENRCVGCLKCALIASNTFAIENKHGRARAVAQWADSEATIHDAVKACPVDCIHWVDRSKLPAYEYIMSKQPRWSVAIDAQSTGGARTVDVFDGVEKFLKKFKQYKEGQGRSSSGSSLRRRARREAADNIQARAGRWWQMFLANTPVCSSQGAIIQMKGAVRKEDQPERSKGMRALYEAAALRRKGIEFSHPRDQYKEEEGYWVPPNTQASSSSTSTSSSSTSASASPFQFQSGTMAFPDISSTSELHAQSVALRKFLSGLPALVSAGAAFNVGMHSQIYQFDIVGPLPAEIAGSLMMQMILAAATWYAVGAVACGGVFWVALKILEYQRQSRT